VEVTPSEPIDGLQLRVARARTGDTPQAHEVSPVCTQASDPAACAASLEALPMGAVRTDVGQSGAVRSDFVWSRGDATGQIDSREALLAWLGPIDAAADARTVIWADGYTPSCHADPEQTDGSWALGATRRVSDCPVTTHSYDLQVSPSGEVTVVATFEGEPGQRCIGRLPEGLEVPTCGEGVGAWLASVAYLEGAAVVAFEQLILELQHYGAPTALIEAARAARADEIRHAEAMTGLARRYGARVPPVDATTGPIRSREAIAADNVREGLVRESHGAAVGLWQAKHAADPVARAVFRSVALDEIRHAEFSRALHAWLDIDVSDAWDRARAALYPRAVPPPSVRGPLGLPNLNQERLLFEAVV